MWQDDAPEGEPLGHTKGRRGLPLTRWHRLDGAALDFRLVGAVGEAKPEPGRAKRRDPLAQASESQTGKNGWKAEIEEEKQQEQRHPPEKFDITHRQELQRPRPIQPGGGHPQPDEECQGKTGQGEDKRDACAIEQQRQVAGNGPARCVVLFLQRPVAGAYRVGKMPGIELIPKLPAGEDFLESPILDHLIQSLVDGVSQGLFPGMHRDGVPSGCEGGTCKRERRVLARITLDHWQVDQNRIQASQFQVSKRLGGRGVACVGNLVAHQQGLGRGAIHRAGLEGGIANEAGVIPETGLTFSDRELLAVKVIRTGKKYRAATVGQDLETVHGEFEIAFQQTGNQALKAVLGE